MGFVFHKCGSVMLALCHQVGFVFVPGVSLGLGVDRLEDGEVAQ